jgi:endonuclease/exonuclease/phosphatase family metal-dependent hydrolase
MTPSETPLYIFNCHLSYNAENFNKNIREMVEYVKPFLSCNCLLAGDMNSHPEASEFDLLRDAGLYDVWAKLRPGDPGSTDPKNDKRIDYIWANFDTFTSIDLVGTIPNAKGILPSDHYGLIAGMNM